VRPRHTRGKPSSLASSARHQTCSRGQACPRAGTFIPISLPPTRARATSPHARSLDKSLCISLWLLCRSLCTSASARPLLMHAAYIMSEVDRSRCERVPCSGTARRPRGMVCIATGVEVRKAPGSHRREAKSSGRSHARNESRDPQHCPSVEAAVRRAILSKSRVNFYGRRNVYW
jgi:hypothetical protein